MNIDLTNGGQAVIDDEDYARVSAHRWCRSRNGYAYSTGPKRETLYLHRLVVGASGGEQVDHKNRDRLDCRRENLRKVTSAQNLMNKSISKVNTSGYKGVSFDKRRNKWRSRIKLNGKELNLGYYSTREDAARAYNGMAAELFGEYACLNDI
jgi:hypothetical protein